MKTNQFQRRQCFFTNIGKYFYTKTDEVLFLRINLVLFLLFFCGVEIDNLL